MLDWHTLEIKNGAWTKPHRFINNQMFVNFKACKIFKIHIWT